MAGGAGSSWGRARNCGLGVADSVRRELGVRQGERGDLSRRYAGAERSRPQKPCPLETMPPRGHAPGLGLGTQGAWPARTVRSRNTPTARARPDACPGSLGPGFAGRAPRLCPTWRHGSGRSSRGESCRSWGARSPAAGGPQGRQAGPRRAVLRASWRLLLAPLGPAWPEPGGWTRPACAACPGHLDGPHCWLCSGPRGVSPGGSCAMVWRASLWGLSRGKNEPAIGPFPFRTVLGHRALRTRAR